jgi:hypothetical protein
MRPIATKNGEALNARGKPRGTPARILSFAASAVALFERLPKGFLCLGFFFAKVVKTAQTPFSD